MTSFPLTNGWLPVPPGRRSTGRGQARRFLSLRLSLWCCLAGCLWAPFALRAGSLYVKSTMDASLWPTNYPSIPRPGPGDRIERVRADSLDGFDAAMRRFADPGTHVYVGPGVFQTQGVWDGGFGQTNQPGFRLQSRSQLHGTRIFANLTTLELMRISTNNGVANENRVICPQLTSPLSDLQVTDLDVDCNAPDLFAFYGRALNLAGVSLYGENSLLRNVNVRNASQIDTNNTMTVETFVLSANAFYGVVTNALIDACSVSNFFNPSQYGKASAISLTKDRIDPGYIRGTIQNCVVELNGFGGEFAYNGLRTRTLVLSNNLSINAAAGFNNDTPFNTNLIIINNTFLLPPSTNSGYGLLMHGASYWCRISSNLFSIRSPNQSAIWMSGEYTNSWNGPPRHLLGVHYALLDHNRIVRTPFAGLSYGFCLNPGGGATPPDHVELVDNWVDPDLVNLFPASVGFAARNSGTFLDASGLPLRQPNPGWVYPSDRSDFGTVGQPCLVLVNSNRNTQIWPMNRASADTPLLLQPDDTGSWRVVGVADFNQDGHADLLLRDDASGGLACWIMSGGRRTAFQRLEAKPEGTFAVAAVADFNGDNHPDLLLQDAQGNLEVWMMDGLQRSQTVAVEPSNSGDIRWHLVGSGDFNDDGQTDILWQYSGEPNDGLLGVWFMHGVVRTKAALLDPSVPEDRRMRVAATGHFNPETSANNTDLIFQLKESDWGGALSIYYLSNTTRLGSPAPISQNPGLFNVIGPR